ncbi:carboxypeptidase-like regulatory domain-containing protein [Tenacibaculum discolor]|uniref:carboxypeptidase-like regulatory domain-containing protein n=1 Tax=Tenacibaculum discolor TaxID=361581 RepID=UPI000EAE526D|nr:carboxypeptidase-like regulatory domain-containing protein [Tenacibaculum discolor]RLK02211.1 carboxypeptidase-like protein [Tenacibaculum discolor]
MIKQLPIILLLLITLGATAQKKRKFLYGVLNDEIGAIPNAHIINLNTKQGTFSTDLGKFRILAKPNDTLQVSFVGYETKKVKVTSLHFGMEENEIKLIKVPFELDEVEVKKHNLIGSIAIDAKQTPKDIGMEKAKRALDFSMIDFQDPIIMPIDEIDKMGVPNMRKVTDPTAKFAGVGGAISLGKNNYSEQLKRTRKKIKFKESFPKMLLSEFGEHFFYKELNIPKDKYLHFLEFCNPLGIEKLYKEKKLLKVIAILQQESKSYLKVISNN